MAEKPSIKKYIADTFEELLNENSVEDISVQDIVNACDISRTTFYRYFEDKYAVMNWIYTKKIEKIIQENPDTQSWKNLVLEIQYFLQEKQEYFKKIMNYEGQNSLHTHIYECGYQYVSSLILQEIKEEKLPKDLEFSARFYSYATAHMALQWLKEGMKDTPEVFAQYICDNIPMPLQKYFK